MLSRIIAARNIWAENLNKSNVNAIINCYKKNAVFKGTMSDDVSYDRDGLEKYFEELLGKNPSVHFIQSTITETDTNLVLDTGVYIFVIGDKTVKANYQFVYDAEHRKPLIISHFSGKMCDD
jgi:hypothetical protein